MQEWQADNDLQIRAAKVALDDGGTIIRVRNEQSRRGRLVKWGPDETSEDLGFSPDNKKVWVGTSLNANSSRLLQFDVATGARKVLAGSAIRRRRRGEQPKTNAFEVVTFFKQRDDDDFIDPK